MASVPLLQFSTYDVVFRFCTFPALFSCCLSPAFHFSTFFHVRHINYPLISATGDCCSAIADVYRPFSTSVFLFSPIFPRSLPGDLDHPPSKPIRPNLNFKARRDIICIIIFDIFISNYLSNVFIFPRFGIYCSLVFRLPSNSGSSAYCQLG